jgi:Dyp-type peroxidase family
MAHTSESDVLDLEDIQGIIISGYNHLRAWSYHFLRFDSGSQSREWVQSIEKLITTAYWGPPNYIHKPARALNVAFTYAGLKHLGLPEQTLGSFAQEFNEGMNQKDRSRRLGDDPTTWEFGNSDSLHALLILQAVDDEDLQQFEGEQVRNYQAHAIAGVTSITGGNSTSSGEHFGFNDGISQPRIEGAPGRAAVGGDQIRPGEFILGYPNEYNVLPSSPSISPDECSRGSQLKPIEENKLDFGRNGSYLVARKLEQNVPAFRKFLRVQAGDNPAEQEWLGAKLVGRWRSGAPLVLSPNADNKDLYNRNDFDYTSTDRNGFACPLGAHIRRSNPRDSLQPNSTESYRTSRRHRLMRRGVPYGRSLPQDVDDDGQARGFLFLCINADIQRQFEFIQQTWINDPKFNGLMSDPDPLLGPTPEDCVFTIQGWPVRRRLNGLQQFVTMRGGGYFFLPGIQAIGVLGSGCEITS